MGTLIEGSIFGFLGHSIRMFETQLLITIFAGCHLIDPWGFLTELPFLVSSRCWLLEEIILYI